jgi:hypothetical protein
MSIKQPPYANGIMDLTDTEKAEILEKLQSIITAFVPDDFQSVADTFYIVSTYNKENPDAPINGDTAQAVLAPTLDSTGV